ncbi:MAG: hypothetical protein Q4C05_03220 [Akkermansia sp.]|nr:hypothetical protein [Akkermansia sp.]
MKWIVCVLMSLCVICHEVSGQSTAEIREKIARQIWKNECGGTVQGLVTWNKGENFPSLGIGHFIWYPRGVREKFEESFPAFIAFCKQKGIRPMPILQGAAPWKDRTAFQQADVKGGLPAQIRQWLASKKLMQVQGEFIMRRSLAALERIKRESDSPNELASKYYAVAATPNGTYALIDYVNFKGEGVNHDERYQGKGWGLMQVLEEMKPVTRGPAAAVEFAEAAKRVLSRRVANSPKSRGEKRWLVGWHNRCDTYKKKL